MADTVVNDLAAMSVVDCKGVNDLIGNSNLADWNIDLKARPQLHIDTGCWVGRESLCHICLNLG